jgi:putative exporter of polyketide antibiotics
VYAVVAWSFVVDLLGSLVDGLGWMQRSSLFHYMALAPAEPVRPAAVVVMLALAGALFATATVLFTRRDVSTG